MTLWELFLAVLVIGAAVLCLSPSKPTGHSKVRMRRKCGGSRKGKRRKGRRRKR